MKTMHTAVALLRTRPEPIVEDYGRSRIRAFAGTAWGRLFATY